MALDDKHARAVQNTLEKPVSNQWGGFAALGKASYLEG
jgi:hypothetical protein